MATCLQMTDKRDIESKERKQNMFNPKIWKSWKTQ